MKTKIFKTVFPIMAFMIAIAGAFAFNVAPEENTEVVAQFLGHYKVGATCTDSGVMCQEENNNIPCTSSTQPALYKKLGNTNCPNQLWRIVE